MKNNPGAIWAHFCRKGSFMEPAPVDASNLGTIGSNIQLRANCCKLSKSRPFCGQAEPLCSIPSMPKGTIKKSQDQMAQAQHHPVAMWQCPQKSTKEYFNYVGNRNARPACMTRLFP